MIDREYRFATWLLIGLCVLALALSARAGELLGCGVLLVVIGLLLRNVMGGVE